MLGWFLESDNYIEDIDASNSRAQKLRVSLKQNIYRVVQEPVYSEVDIR